VITALRATLDAPKHIEVSGDSVDIDARVTLTNQSDHSVVLSSPAGEDPHFWHVLNEQQREVARSAGDQAHAQHHTSPMIATGHEAHEAFQARVPAKKLKAGKTYTLRVVFHGCSAEVRFTAFAAPKPKAAAKASAKKAPAKKPALVKKAVGKPAKKKAAKKKG
jgi:hypothetical protein